MSCRTIDDVREFWESAPLFTGESAFPPGTREFFEQHRSVIVKDCLAGEFDRRTLPTDENNDHVLDLGCGPGFWTIELSRNGARKITASDLTENALTLTRRRAEIYGVQVETSQQNAEHMTFPDGTFSHVNCQGVIHHTPNTEACIREIARVLRPNGTASISVYYKNVLLRLWPLLKYSGKALTAMGAGLKGRGRERIYATDDVNELVRLYDGEKNPIGKAYSKREFVNMLAPYFQVEETFLHFFPARSLPFRIPVRLHKLLDKTTGCMIYATCRKPKPMGNDA